MEKYNDILKGLPVAEVADELLKALGRSNCAVLQAPPGAGKTTALPLCFLNAEWLKGRKIIMLEPRRIAARSAAGRLAWHLREQVAGTIGFRTRLETKVSRETRLEVVTEAILTRIIQNDPGLEEYGMVIFDEFHERSIPSDLGLAFTLDSQRTIRNDLRILIMSATIEAEAISRKLHAPVFISRGRSYPVEILYSPVPEKTRLEDHLVRQILSGLSRYQASMLVFLPGSNEIKRCAALLEQQMNRPDTEVFPLYGDLPADRQDAAIQPALPGKRKIVLATSIAETSLTIDGVNIVIDSGLSRIPRYDPSSGFTRLETVPVTQDSAGQRSGRAGRTGPGICIRLWEQSVQSTLLISRIPEILSSDLSNLWLELAGWGAKDPAELFWLDQPLSSAISEAQELLLELEALDKKGGITEHGKKMLSFHSHPRLSHMMIKAKETGLARLACILASILNEQDIFRFGDKTRNSDISLRLDILLGTRSAAADSHIDWSGCRRVMDQAQRWQEMLGTASGGREKWNDDDIGPVLAFAYPDRIGMRRLESKRHYLLSNGRGAFFQEKDPFLLTEYIVAANLDGKGADARILLAGHLDPKKLNEYFKDEIGTVSFIQWDERTESVLAKKQVKLFQLVLEESTLHEPDQELVKKAVIKGIQSLGADVLPWEKGTRAWQDRVLFLHGLENGKWPDVSDESLLASLANWLGPYLTGIRRRQDFRNIRLRDALASMLDHRQKQELEKSAPETIQVPSHSRIRLDYSDHKKPALAVRIQEVFGLKATPKVANGRVAVVMHLLSPANRPIQVTQDLESFWKNTYSQVRKELRGEYPKHYWPEDPSQAIATRRVRPRK
ncbi:MAG: ATP-dependent helicase HrpB [bacterium]|nr:ATP-dependent helicase HrpB [bacterium]